MLLFPGAHYRLLVRASNSQRQLCNSGNTLLETPVRLDLGLSRRRLRVAPDVTYGRMAVDGKKPYSLGKVPKLRNPNNYKY